MAPMLQEGGVAGAVNPLTPPAFQEMAFRFFALMGSPGFSRNIISFSPLSPLGASRYFEVSNASFANWTKVGCI